MTERYWTNLYFASWAQKLRKETLLTAALLVEFEYYFKEFKCEFYALFIYSKLPYLLC